MSSILLDTLNQYDGTKLTAEDAIKYVARACSTPLPDRIAMDDWRAHVPMHLLEQWLTLSDDERIAIYVMAQSATHPYDSGCECGPGDPGLN